MKGKPTPKREAQRRLNVERARQSQKDDPNIRRLYEAFAPPPGSKRRKATHA